MSRLARRSLTAVALLAACILLGYQFLPRDETRIDGLLGELCVELNQARDQASLALLQDWLGSHLLPEASLRAPEYGPELAGLETLRLRSPELLSGAPLSFALSGVEVHAGGHLARVEADLSITVRGSGEQRRELRRTRVRLSKSGSSWRIEAVEVDPALPAQPEARP